MSDDQAKAAYVKRHNIHHLFELLASRVLTKQPDDVFQFLREQVDDIERVEKTQRSYDPGEIRYNKTPSPTQPKPQSPVGAKSEEPAAPKKVTLGVFGLDNAGKTALIAAIGGAPNKETQPTVGFSPHMFETDLYDVCIFDLGGAAGFRSIWPHYYHDCHAVIYVVDGSDEKRFGDSAALFRDVVAHRYLATKPLLVFSNKNDVAGHANAAAVLGEAMSDVVPSATALKSASCCAIADHDTAIDEGTEWVLNAVCEDYDRLAGLVQEHTAEVKAEKKRKLEEQRRRVEEARARDAEA